MLQVLRPLKLKHVINLYERNICRPILRSQFPLTIQRCFSDQRRDEGNDKMQSRKVGMLSSIGLGATLLFGKTKYLLVALKFTKAAPLVSMVLSSGA